MLYKVAIITTIKDPFMRLAQILNENNYQINFMNTDEIGNKNSKIYKADFICLHLEYNDLINQHVISTIKKTSNVPLYVFGKNHTEEQRVNLLTAGSEGYIEVPFSDIELFARIRSVINYIYSLTKRNHKKIHVGPVKIDLSNHAIENGQDVHHLTKVEYKILNILLESKDETVTKDRIINYVWDDHKSATDNALGIHITRLRKKIHFDHRIELIETIWGVGYRFNYKLCEQNS